MASQQVIRIPFVWEYVERQEQRRAEDWELIEDRNARHRKLNEQFGYAEPDGSFGIGCKSHIDREYKQFYDHIEAEFRPLYDASGTRFDAWLRSQEITIYEYLFLEIMDRDQLLEMSDVSQKEADWEWRPIQAKARLFVRRLKPFNTVGEIRRVLDLEIANHRYVRARCRRFFCLRPWDVSAHLAIFDYGRDWRESLNRSFNGMTAE